MLRRLASLAGVSLIAGGATALVLFAASSQARPLSSSMGGVIAQAATSTTSGGSGSGSGSGSGATTTTTAPSTTSSTAAPTCNTSPTISVTVQAVVQGGSTGVNGACFARNVDVTLTLFSDPVFLGTARTDGFGNFSITVSVPSSVPEGSHTLTAASGDQAASTALIVANGTPLAVTGYSWNLLILGIALVAAGVIVMAGDRIGKQELIEFL